MTNAFLYFEVALFGAIIGSFLNVVILRDGKRMSIVTGRSECPHCNHQLAWYDLIPIISFASLGGKCRYCRTPISWQYPIIELAAAGLAVFAFWFGFLLHASGLLAGLLGVALALFLVVSVIDIKTQEVSLEYCVAAGIMGGAAMFFSHALTALQILEGLGVGAGLILVIIYGWKLIMKQDGMGIGDAWILGAIGCVLGFPSIIVAFIVATLLGAVIGSLALINSKNGLKSTIPFGPFLCIGMLVALVWGQQVVQWYTLGL
jgi:leader peptidase (prepilin peptidase)/N-methyltransferase